MCSSHPGYFGKVGMRHFHLKRNAYHCPAVNVDLLWSLLSEEDQARTKKEGDSGSGVAPIIDLNAKVSAVAEDGCMCRRSGRRWCTTAVMGAADSLTRCRCYRASSR
jgi:hypothetical protein